MNITGIYFAYYNVCHRKLWLFANKIDMEHNSEIVDLGRFISNSTYEREKHEIHLINENFDIVLDYFDSKNNIIHEIKKSTKMEDSHIWQVKFYIYVLIQLGLKNVTGVIDYPLLRKKVSVELTPDDFKKIESYIKDIKDIITNEIPPKPINKPFCKNCSYFELCYI